MATRADFQMLNDALGNLGNSFVINRQMEQTEKEHALDRDMRERMLNEQIEGRKEAAALRTQPTIKWTSGGREFTYHSLDEAAPLMQKYAADRDKDGAFTIRMSGVLPSGVPVEIPYRIPGNTEKTPEAHQRISKELNDFATALGLKPKAKDATETPLNYPPGTMLRSATGGIHSVPYPPHDGTGVATTVEEIPAQPEQKVVVQPEKPAVHHWQPWKDDEPFVPGITNTIPAQNAKKITTKQKIVPPSQTGGAAQRDADALDMPATQAEMEKGKKYWTKRGNAVWDGTAFVK